MLDTWSSTANTLGTDFNLYSTFEDAKKETNPWTFCNYNSNEVGFPRDCSPEEAEAATLQWNSLTDVHGLGRDNY